MANSLRAEASIQKLEAEHRKWLSGFEPKYLSKWEGELRRDQEAALAEAGVRGLLESYGVAVRASDKPGTGGPDFSCCRANNKFYVEVTNISIDTATNMTGLPDERSSAKASVNPTANTTMPGEENPRVRSFQLLNRAIYNKCVGKVQQCANRDAPVLVAITTWHDLAARINFQEPFVNLWALGEIKCTYPIDMRSGKIGSGFQVTETKFAPFLDRTEEDCLKREPLSGLLLVHPMMQELPILGVLHPNPVRSFHPTILPQVEFGRVAVDQASGQLRVDWPKEKDECAARSVAQRKYRG